MIEIHQETEIHGPIDAILAGIVDLRGYGRWLTPSTAYAGTTDISSDPITAGATCVEAGLEAFASPKPSRRRGVNMSASDESQPPSRDIDGGEDVEEDPGEELEAMIEQADRPFASESFGTTAEEQEEGEPLDQRLAEERPAKPPLDLQLAIEDFDAPDDEKELVGQASLEHDRFVAPEEAAMTVRDSAPGAVDHPDDHDVEPDDESSEEA